jgi:hypothetical protein
MHEDSKYSGVNFKRRFCILRGPLILSYVSADTADPKGRWNCPPPSTPRSPPHPWILPSTGGLIAVHGQAVPLSPPSCPLPHTAHCLTTVRRRVHPGWCHHSKGSTGGPTVGSGLPGQWLQPGHTLLLHHLPTHQWQLLGVLRQLHGGPGRVAGGHRRHGGRHSAA